MTQVMDLYTKMAISYVGIQPIVSTHDDPIRLIAKHQLMIQVEQFLKDTSFKPETIVWASKTCQCSAYAEDHRIGLGLCTKKAHSTMDALLALTEFPGYKDGAMIVLRAWAERILNLALTAEGIDAYHRYSPALRWLQTVTKGIRNHEARECLAELYLSQSTADPIQWWLDQYTEEIDPEAADELNTNRTAQKWLKDEAASVESATFTIGDQTMIVDATKSAGKEDAVLLAYLTMKNPAGELIYSADEARKLARLANDAMISSLSDDEPSERQLIENDDDRKFTPPPLLKDFNPDMSCIDWKVVNAFRSFKSECWDRAYYMFPLTKGEQAAKNLIHKTVADKEAVHNERQDAQELLDSANQAGDQLTIDYAESRVNLAKGPQLSSWDWKVIKARNATFANLFNDSKYAHDYDDPKDIVKIVKIVQYAPVTPEDEKAGEVFSYSCSYVQVKNTITVRDDLLSYVNNLAQQGNDPETGSALQAAAVIIYGYVGEESDTTIGIEELSHDLQDCLIDYEQDIADRSGSGNKLTGDDTHINLKAYDAQFMIEMENELLNYSRPEISYPYVMAYIKASGSGATDEAATATSWNAWRNDMTWRGAKQYDAVLLLGGTKSAAWKAFWTECKAYVPRQKSKIVSASKLGLKIIPAPVTYKPLKPMMLDGVEIAAPVGDAVEEATVEPREIGWGIAVNKMRNGEFDLSNKSNILGLKSKGWSQASYFLSLVAKA